jgi:hypothetical protein
MRVMVTDVDLVAERQLNSATAPMKSFASAVTAAAAAAAATMTIMIAALPLTPKSTTTMAATTTPSYLTPMLMPAALIATLRQQRPLLLLALTAPGPALSLRVLHVSSALSRAVMAAGPLLATCVIMSSAQSTWPLCCSRDVMVILLVTVMLMVVVMVMVIMMVVVMMMMVVVMMMNALDSLLRQRHHYPLQPLHQSFPNSLQSRPLFPTRQRFFNHLL